MCSSFILLTVRIKIQNMHKIFSVQKRKRLWNVVFQLQLERYHPAINHWIGRDEAQTEPNGFNNYLRGLCHGTLSSTNESRKTERKQKFELFVYLPQ